MRGRSLATGLAFVVLAATACGKYGPPVRADATPAAKTAPVSAVPATSNTEECADPDPSTAKNAPGASAARTTP